VVYERFTTLTGLSQALRDVGGTETITSTSASALTAGANAAPTGLKIDASAASVPNEQGAA